MALIIKADMPICCDRCFYSSRCFTYSKTVQKLLLSEHEQMFDVFGETRLHGCPILGEIPDEHGRLIDADEAKKAIKERIDRIDRKPDGSYYYEFDAFFNNGLIRAIQSIDKIPTVLEAST